MERTDLLQQSDRQPFSPARYSRPKRRRGVQRHFRDRGRHPANWARILSASPTAQAGSTSKKTVEVASYIQDTPPHSPPWPTLTCCDSSTREEIAPAPGGDEGAEGIENILALRGDRPKDFVPGPYTYAVQLIRDIKAQGDFCVGGACYPEGHVECPHKEDDIAYLKGKGGRRLRFPHHPDVL